MIILYKYFDVTVVIISFKCIMNKKLNYGTASVGMSIVISL